VLLTRQVANSLLIDYRVTLNTTMGLGKLQMYVSKLLQNRWDSTFNYKYWGK